MQIHPGTVRLSGGLQASGQDSSENGLGEDYSSAFASPPRDLPAATAPAAPPPSVLGPHHAQPPQQPQGPMPNDGPPAQAANRHACIFSDVQFRPPYKLIAEHWERVGIPAIVPATLLRR